MVIKRRGPAESIDMDVLSGWGIRAVNHVQKEFFMLTTPDISAGLPIHCAEMSALMLVVDTWTGQRFDLERPGNE